MCKYIIQNLVSPLSCPCPSSPRSPHPSPVVCLVRVTAIGLVTFQKIICHVHNCRELGMRVTASLRILLLRYVLEFSLFWIYEPSFSSSIHKCLGYLV